MIYKALLYIVVKSGLNVPQMDDLYNPVLDVIELSTYRSTNPKIGLYKSSIIDDLYNPILDVIELRSY